MEKEETKEEKILKYVARYDYVKGKNYYKGYIKPVEKVDMLSAVLNKFKVESERINKIYEVNIIYDKNSKKIIRTYCDCPQFKATYSCKHVATCLYNYYENIFPKEETIKDIISITNELFNKLNTIEDNKRYVKEEVNIEVYLYANNDFNRRSIMEISLKAGTNKLYVCKNNKLNNFLDAVKDESNYCFGKDFTYDYRKNYFSEDNQRILDYIINNNESNYGYPDNYLVGDRNIISFIKLLKNTKFYLNDYLINNISNSFPFESKLSKKDGNYVLKILKNDDIYYITSDLEYVQIKNTLYKLNKKEKTLLSNLISLSYDEFIFTDNEKTNFKNNVLPVLKNNIEIDSEIKDMKIIKEIKPKLYFDLYKDKITCDVVFKYDDDEINYFAKESDFLRDKTFEDEIINYLYNYNFNIENDKLVLDDISKIGKFLDEDLIKITDNYETYTSEKLKKIKIIKKNNIRSTFSIGQDNIMSYSFDLGDIKQEEIVNILESLKDNKKYYRLKSGDIIDLDDSNIKEFDNLTKDLNLNKKDLLKSSGEIPKYRAIYLDSIKDSKYHIISTNNLFDELITNFKKYKDSKISLNKKDKEILREYQIDGIKWLYNIDKTGFGGILADEMGLGKSIQTIYYLKELLKEDKTYKFLIVAPTSLAYNWENEFDKFGKEIKYKTMVGLRSERRRELKNIDKYNCIITTYGLLREDKEIYDKINFRVMIIDEAQNIKNNNTEITKTVKSIKASTKLALTGTPIENSLSELWSIFDFVMPGFLGEQQGFDAKYKIKDLDSEADEKLDSLNKIVSPFILRRRKKDVIKDLPDKIENNIYVELTSEQKKLYLAELEKVNKEIDKALEEGGISKVRFLILKLLTKLRQICIDPRIVFSSYIGGSGKMDEFIKVVKETTRNGHKILIFTSFKQALLLAKSELDKNKITSYIIDGSVSSKKRMELVDKFNNDDTNVFFIMLKAGGTGLNLTSADVVIHLDLWWNPQAENQATDRAHRIGQKNVVTVVKFITKGTIEEKILDLQQKKKILSEKLIDSNNDTNSFSKLTEKDIKELLSYENSDN